MTSTTLADRFQRIIAHYDGGNLTAFARRVGVSQSTLYRNLKGGDEQLLLGLVGWILLALPALSRRWLLYDEGEMLLPAEGVGESKNASGSEAVAKSQQNDSTVDHLRYVIECQKHTLEIQTRMLELRTEDFFKSTSALGGTAAALSAQHHNE